MFKRISNLVKGFLGLFLKGIEKKSPSALLQVEMDKMKDQLSKHNQGLAYQAGAASRISSELEKSKASAAEYRLKALALQKAGDEESAGDFAQKYTSEKGRSDSLEKQLEAMESKYQELISMRDISVRKSKEAIETLKNKIQDLKTSRIIAETSEMANSLMNEFSTSSLSYIEEIVDEEMDLQKGRVRVSQGAELLREVQMENAVGRIQGQEALAALMAEAGTKPKALTLGGAPKTQGETSSTSMGPVTTQ